MDLTESVERIEGSATLRPAPEPVPVPSWEAECNCPDACTRDHEQD